SLERRLVAYAAANAPTRDTETPTRAGIAAAESLSAAPTAGTMEHPRASAHRGRVLGRVWRPWQLVAAAVLVLIVTTSVLTAAAAASAGSGSPLFGLHRAEQNVRVQLASSQGDRVRLHLSYAYEALSQLDGAVRHGSGDPTYTGALAIFLTEQQAAADG